MKLYYCTTFDNQTFIDYEKHGNMLWDSAVVGTNALLDQLLMRLGMGQNAAENSEKGIEARRQAYGLLMNDDWVRPSKEADLEATVDSVLSWRDCLLMEGWNATMEFTSKRLRSLAQWEKGYNLDQTPGRADLWKQVHDAVVGGQIKLNMASLEVEVCMPQVLVPRLIRETLEAVATVTYRSYDDTQLRTEGRKLVEVKELYEAWQLAALKERSDEMMVVCANDERMIDTMKGLRGEQWSEKKAGCLHPAEDITNQLDEPRCILWLDCAGNKGGEYRFGFLSLGELAELEAAGLKLPTEEESANARMRWITTLLNKAEEVEIISPQRNEGELLGEHPMVTELKYRGVAVEEASSLPKTSHNGYVRYMPTDYVNLDDVAVKTLPHASESATTLDGLFQSPFDYLLEKMAGMKAPEDDSDTNLDIEKGKVAHKVVEIMVKNNESNLSNYVDNFHQALEEDGPLLKEPENKNVLAIYMDELKESVEVLFKTIKELELTPVDCEVEFDKPFDCFNNPHGYIDMLLKNKDDQWVILDLKFSKSKYYKEMLKKNQSLQLTFYSHGLKALKEGDVAWCGYYLFPLMMLYATPSAPIGVEHVEVVARDADALSDEDYWQMVQNSYKERIREIGTGKIEEGEGFDLSGLGLKGDGYVDIKGDNDVSDKKRNDFCKFRSVGNPLEKPTKHMVLKNHIK